MKKTVVFDFDGVIHSYTSGWKGEDVIPDPPVIGIKDSIQQIRNAGYEVVVVSTRCATSKGLEAVKTYLSDYEITVDRVCKEKPPAIVYVDDRAICFDGKSEELFDKIESFEPWYKKKTTMINEIRADMLKVKKMVSEVEMIIGKREGNSQLVNQLIDAENLLTYCMSRLENAFLSRNADSAFQDGLNEARDLYKAEVQDEIKAEAVKEFAEEVKKEVAYCSDSTDELIIFQSEFDNLLKEYTSDIDVGTKEEMTSEKALEGKAHNCCKKFEDYPITIGIQKGNTGYRVAYEFLWDDGNYYGDYLDIGESINANKVADAVRLLYNQAEGLFEALKERKIEK